MRPKHLGCAIFTHAHTMRLILVQYPRNHMELVDIPVADIKVLNRLRKTDAHKIQELAESIKRH